MGEKWGFFLLFDAIIAHRCATMRYDSASPKTGAWPSLVHTAVPQLPAVSIPTDTLCNLINGLGSAENASPRHSEKVSLHK